MELEVALELVWFLLPVTALLWQVGGTWKKQFRRLLIPCVFAFTLSYYLGITFWWVITAIAYFAIFALPITLIGKDVHKHWFNWVWFWIYGFILGLPAVIPGIYTNHFAMSLWLTLIPTVLGGMSITASNINSMKDVVVWKLVEAFMGIVVAMPICYLIQFKP